MTTTKSSHLNTMTPTIVNAPCQSTDSETFFPDPTEIEKIALAKSFCATCLPTVKNECLSFALDNRIRYGVWGGMTENERHNLLRQKNRKR